MQITPQLPLSNLCSDEVLPPMSEEKRLCRNLMANYSLVGLNGRPVINTSQPSTVEFGLGLIQMDLDERNKILTTSMWARYVSTRRSLCTDHPLLGPLHAHYVNGEDRGNVHCMGARWSTVTGNTHMGPLCEYLVVC